MIQEIKVILRKQIPSKGKYLYRFDNNRYIISTQVHLGKEDTEWDECDEVQKAEFEAHNAAAVQEELEKELIEA